PGFGGRVAPLESLSCFFPAFNEEDNLPRLLDEAVDVLPEVADRWEVIVVDDGSVDQSASVVQEFMTTHPEVRLVQHGRNLGSGHATRSGLLASKYEAVFFSDADCQFRLADVERLLPYVESSDLICGYRIKRADGWKRLAIARVYHRVLARMFDLHVRDI